MDTEEMRKDAYILQLKAMLYEAVNDLNEFCNKKSSHLEDKIVTEKLSIMNINNQSIGEIRLRNKWYKADKALELLEKYI